MAKKPKTEWQIAVKAKMDATGLTYAELSKLIDVDDAIIRQVMCKDNMPRVKAKICEYLGIELEG